MAIFNGHFWLIIANRLVQEECRQMLESSMKFNRLDAVTADEVQTIFVLLIHFLAILARKHFYKFCYDVKIKKKFLSFCESTIEMLKK